jgi:hypothetical protein
MHAGPVLPALTTLPKLGSGGAQMTLSSVDQQSHVEIELCYWVALVIVVCSRCWLRGFRDRVFVSGSE